MKSVDYILRSMNPCLNSGECQRAELGQAFDSLQDVDTPILPFYFNAWSNDFVDDPITAIFASMAAEFDRCDLLNTSNFVKGLTSVVDAGLALGQIPLRVSGAADAFRGESVIKAYQERAEIRSRISELCGDALREVANKLVIFIDELNRCRPDFAVRLLEQTKNLFIADNIILVFAADSSQLAKGVAGVYGPGFDAQRFLTRFLMNA